jgi:hypothetical protein
MAGHDEPRDAETDDLFFDEDSMPESYAMRSAVRAHGGVDDSDGSAWGEDESGHAWQQYFHEPVREPYGGPAGTGEHVPYGGRRFAYGRESSAAREYGQLYGHDVRNYGHRRDSYYARADATPWWEIPLEPDTPSYAGVGPRGYRRPDARIEEEVVQRLAEAEWVDATDVEVEVSDGVITLAGQVETRVERRAAVEIAAEVAGAVDVVNELRARQGRRPPTA